MRSWIKSTLAVLLLFGVCWTGAIWYWRDTNRMPSTADLLIFMLAVPFALLLAVWLGRKLLALAAAAPAVTVNAAPAPTATPAQQAVPALSLLAAAVRTPHGAATDELAAAIEAQNARAALDPELLDDNGFPLMSARVPDAGDATTRDEIAQWLTANGHADASFSDEQWRAVLLASAVTTDLAWPAASHASLAATEGAPQPPLLQLIALLPAGWPEAQRLPLLAWLRHKVAQCGWPLARISASAPAQAAPVATLTQLARHGQTSAEPVLAIVLACGSSIGEASVNALRASLFGANRPNGIIPGEGAAGLLVADATQAALIDADPQPLLSTVAGMRDGSADQNGRPDAAVLRKLADHLLESAAVDAASVALVLSDADHRTGRVMEVMALAAGTVPHLDTATDVHATGTACGYCGTVPYLTALALARRDAIERGQPVLALSVDDPHYRSAALVRPPAAQSSFA